MQYSEESDQDTHTKARRSSLESLNSGRDDTAGAPNVTFVNQKPRLICSLADKSQSAHMNAAASPLLNLPPEVRNRIYNFIFNIGEVYLKFKPDLNNKFKIMRKQCCRIIIDENTKEPPQFPHDCTTEHPEPVIPFEFLRVCRQIHDEAALLPYTINSFEAVNDWVATHLLRWLSSDQKRAMEKLLVQSPLRRDHPRIRDASLGHVAQYKFDGKRFLAKGLFARGFYYCQKCRKEVLGNAAPELELHMRELGFDPRL